MGTDKKWGNDFTPRAFKGTQEPPGLSAGQNASILDALRGPAPVPVTEPTRRVIPSAPSAPRTPPAEPRAFTPDPPRPATSTRPTTTAPAAPRTIAPASPPPRAAAAPTTAAVPASPRSSVQAPPTSPAQGKVEELRQQVLAAQEAVQAADHRAGQERAARVRAEQQAEQAREDLKRVKVPVAAAVAKPSAPPRGAVHAKLTPKLMRFPPLLLDRLTALALAYGLDQTSTVRLALTELYERAVAAGTVTV